MTESRRVPAGAPVSNPPALRRSWRAPRVEDLPALEDLTLQSPIVGGEHGFSWLDVTDRTGHLG